MTQTGLLLVSFSFFFGAFGPTSQTSIKREEKEDVQTLSCKPYSLLSSSFFLLDILKVSDLPSRSCPFFSKAFLHFSKLSNVTKAMPRLSPVSLSKGRRNSSMEDAKSPKKSLSCPSPTVKGMFLSGKSRLRKKGERKAFKLDKDRPVFLVLCLHGHISVLA